jgi:hypothetical protein
MKFSLLAAVFGVPVLGNKIARRDVEKPKVRGYRQELRNEQDVQYFADFKIGGQEIAGIFDTGSFEVVVRSSRCTRCSHPTVPYKHEQSSTFVANGSVAMHNYGSGSCKTVLGYDTVQVGPKLVAEKQPIWEIVEHRIPVLDQAKFAAIVGIGPKFGYDSKAKTLLMNYKVDEFSICLKKEAGASGYLTWGPDKDAEMKKEDVAVAKVKGKHHWATSLTQVRFGDEVKMSKAKSDGKNGSKDEVVDVCAKGCAAIIDSGTSLIAAPTAALVALSKQIGHIEEDCSNLDQLPSLRFMLDGKEMVLPPRAYVMNVKGASLEADSIWDLLFFKPKLRKTDSCMPAFMQMDMTTSLGEVWIFGMPFFRYFHTTFNREKGTMQFAKAGADCDPEPINSEDSKLEAAQDNKFMFVKTPEQKVITVDPKMLIPPRLSLLADDSSKSWLEL